MSFCCTPTGAPVASSQVRNVCPFSLSFKEERLRVQPTDNWHVPVMQEVSGKTESKKIKLLILRTSKAIEDAALERRYTIYLIEPAHRLVSHRE
jgi:hypothetical protein